MIKITHCFILALLILGLGACISNSDPETIDPEELLSDSVTTKITHELGAVRKNIEQSANMYNRLSDLRCPYRSGLALSNKSDYELSSQKAILFGSYAAGFVYSSSYEQQQVASNYLKTILELAEELGISESIDEEELKLLLSEKPEIDKSAILTRVYLRATEQLYTEQRAILVGYMVLGGWIEGMRMSYETCGEYLEEESIRLGLYDQTYTYFSCKRILESFEDREEVASVLKKLSEFEPLVEEVIQSRGAIDPELFSKVQTRIKQLRQEILN